MHLRKILILNTLNYISTDMIKTQYNRNLFTTTLGVLALAGSASAATIIVDMTTSGATGAALDNGTALTNLPFSVTVDEAVGVSETAGLQITMASGSSFDSANSTVNGAGGSFGINSPTPSGGSENAARFDVDASELLTVSFNQAITLTAVQLTSFSGTETFSVGGESFGDSDADSSNNYSFSGGGLSFAANEDIVIFAGGDAGASVGLVSMTIETQAVPEPSSALLLGFGALGLAVRRRI